MYLLFNKIFWIRLFFKLLGLVCIGAGLYGLQIFGSEILPLYKRLIIGLPDTVKIFMVLTSFFLGAPALIVMGIKLFFLRSFSHKMLFLSLFPVAYWFLPAYGFDTLFEMDRLLTFGVLFFFTYVVFLNLSFFVHKHWYTPQSREKMGHVGTEEQNKKPNVFLRVVLFVAVVFVLLALHPTDFPTTMSRLMSPIQYLASLFL